MISISAVVLEDRNGAYLTRSQSSIAGVGLEVFDTLLRSTVAAFAQDICTKIFP